MNQATAAQNEAAAVEATKPHSGAKIQLSENETLDHAKALAAAADAMFKEEKPWEKMTPAERQAKLAKEAAEKKAKAEKEARENPTVDENGEHIQTVAEAKAEAAQLQQMLV